MENRQFYTLLLPEKKDINLQMLEDFYALKGLLLDRQADVSLGCSIFEDELRVISRQNPTILFKVERTVGFDNKFASYMLFCKSGIIEEVPFKEPNAPEWLME